ncbi:hypothetical protein DEO72_LG7g1894 [Vigna unguiculata]|uniref:Uncharacterized protein n=1 Tax=Vigna unguiculata TaxID=3917 RepID=A0A4D6MIJ2_VIGUN|nr:hypothetical protein DEO72_LG7g1894 [Vigna unguiculata]
MRLRGEVVRCYCAEQNVGGVRHGAGSLARCRRWWRASFHRCCVMSRRWRCGCRGFWCVAGEVRRCGGSVKDSQVQAWWLQLLFSSGGGAPRWPARLAAATVWRVVMVVEIRREGFAGAGAVVAASLLLWWWRAAAAGEIGGGGCVEGGHGG